jgi:hypothetical protein
LFRPNTLIVLGAASSADFGFPLGRTLKSDIGKLLDVRFNDYGEMDPLSDSQRVFFGNLFGNADRDYRHQIHEAARVVSRGVGLAASIDNFLEMRQDNPLVNEVAKAAIVQIIAWHEAKEPRLQALRRQRHGSTTPNFDNSWLQEFAHICFTGTPKAKLDENLSRVSFISFNYDRCVSQFIRIAIELLYSAEPEEAARLAQTALILHPYGSLGSLAENSRDRFDFGKLPGSNLSALTARIRTFTEGLNEENALLKIKNQVAAADRIVFLGFGYHQQNLDILTVDPTTSKRHRTILGTSMGISDSARLDLNDKLNLAIQGASKSVSAMFSSPILEAKDCRQLLEENRHSLIA